MNRITSTLSTHAAQIHRFCGINSLTANNKHFSTPLQCVANSQSGTLTKHFGSSPVLGASATKLKHLKTRIERKAFETIDVTEDKVLYVYNRKFIPIAVIVFSISGVLFLALELTNALGILSGFEVNIPKELLPKPEEIAWYQWWKKLPLGGRVWKWFLIIFNISLGWVAFLASMLIPYRIVRKVTLLRGATTAVLETFGPFGMQRTVSKPVKELSCGRLSRSDATDILAIRLKGYRGPFALNQTGEYSDKILFDRTVGMFRDFN